MTQKKIHLLLQKYGHLQILINSVEAFLELFLYEEGNLGKINPKLREGLLRKHRTLGSKLDISNNLINDESLKTDLWNLNQGRIKLAHKMLIQVKEDGSLYFASIDKFQIIPEDEIFFDKYIELARSILKKLIPLVNKRSLS